MILVDHEILAAIERKSIVIEPFKREYLGCNSYDIHLGKTLAHYPQSTNYANRPLDCAKENVVIYEEISTKGEVLYPGILYLGVTEEYTETHDHVPFLEGKSSVGRLGIFIHATAGRGDIGFCNHWTLEISVVQPVRVYAGMPIGQLIYYTSSTPLVPYGRKGAGAQYNGRDDRPQPSRMYKNFLVEK
jgi:dCTP deaminase